MTSTIQDRALIGVLLICLGLFTTVGMTGL